MTIDIPRISLLQELSKAIRDGYHSGTFHCLKLNRNYGDSITIEVISVEKSFQEWNYIDRSFVASHKTPPMSLKEGHEVYENYEIVFWLNDEKYKMAFHRTSLEAGKFINFLMKTSLDKILTLTSEYVTTERGYHFYQLKIK